MEREIHHRGAVIDGAGIPKKNTVPETSDPDLHNQGAPAPSLSQLVPQLHNDGLSPFRLVTFSGSHHGLLAPVACTGMAETHVWRITT